MRARSAGVDFFAPYITEVLGHAGMPFIQLGREDLTDEITRCPVLVLSHDTTTDEAERVMMERFVREGGTLIALGGASGLEEVLGVSMAEPRV